MRDQFSLTESGRKAWDTRRRRALEDAARVRIALVQRIDTREYYAGGWGFEQFWTVDAFRAQQLPIDVADRAVRNLKKAGILAETISL